MTVRIKVNRLYKKDTYTIGKMFINGDFFCDTLEDKDRGLKQSMLKNDIVRIKVPAQTAIPTGTYKVTLDVYSPKFGQQDFYKRVCKGYLPRLLDVNGYDGVLVHCLTPETEILTEYGWQSLEQFNSNVPNNVYSYNVDKKIIELTPINFKVEEDYVGRLFRNNGRRLSYAVTDKHRMYVNIKKHGGNREWQWRTADDIPCQSKFIVASNKEGIKLDAQHKLFYRLIMAVQADGYIQNWSNTASQVRFHFTKERKINRLIELLKELDCEYKMFLDNEGKTHITLDSDISMAITEMLNPTRSIKPIKELPWELLMFDSSDLKDLLMEYLFWDGRWENYQKNNLNMNISSTNTHTLDVLQAMAVCCGMRSYIKKVSDKRYNHNECYELVVYENQDVVMPESDTYNSEDYNGKVWCLNNDNHTLIIRHNRRPMVIGNCGNTAEDTMGCLLVGENKAVGKVINSQKTFERLYAKLKGDNDITIEII